MNTQIKVGDRVRSLVTEADVKEGKEYVVSHGAEQGQTVFVTDDAGDEYALFDGEYQTVVRAFKAGDRVRIVRRVDGPQFHWNKYDMDKLVGRMGTVGERCLSNGSVQVFADDDGGEHWFYLPASLELVPEAAKAAPVYLIAGMATEYPTQEAAEEFLASLGEQGKEYAITQVVRRVRVNRTTTLETL